VKLRRFVSVLFTFCIFGYLEGVEWSEPECIAFGSGSGFALDNQGVLWYCIAPVGIYSYRSEALGWQLEIESDVWWQICFDKGDTLWNLGWPGAFRIYYVRYDGESWSEREDVPTFPYSPEDLPWSPIILDSNGVVWVGWTSWGFTVIAYNRYKDGVWHGVEHIVDSGNYDSLRNLLAMTTDASGRLWVGWSRWSVDGDDTLEVSYYDGENWSEAMPIGESLFFIYAYLDLAPDEEGGMWALWSQDGGLEGAYILQARYWDGESWLSTDTITNASAGLPQIAVDTHNTAWAVWVQHEDIYYSFNTGNGWSEPAPVDEHPEVDGSPIIAVDGAGRIWCVWSSNREGEDKWDYSIWASYTTSSGVEEGSFIQPPKSAIESIYPNPFHSSTTISYSVAGRLGSNGTQSVKLSIFDVSGREVKVLASGEKTPGHYEVTWNGKDAKGASCPSGVYFIRMRSEEFNANQRIILLR